MEIKVLKRIEKTTDHAGNDDYVVYYKNKNNEWEAPLYSDNEAYYKDTFISAKENSWDKLEAVEYQDIAEFSDEILDYMSESEIVEILNNDAPWTDYMNEFFVTAYMELTNIFKKGE